MAKTDYLKFGFLSTLGGMGVYVLMGLCALSGILLIIGSKKKDEEEPNKTMFIIGAILLVLAALPFLPMIGLSFLFDEASE